MQKFSLSQYSVRETVEYAFFITLDTFLLVSIFQFVPYLWALAYIAFAHYLYIFMECEQ